MTQFNKILQLTRTLEKTLGKIVLEDIKVANGNVISKRSQSIETIEKNLENNRRSSEKLDDNTLTFTDYLDNPTEQCFISSIKLL